jgi:hypothetical protein
MAAMVSFLRTFLNIVPFETRAPNHAHRGGREMPRGGSEISWGVPSRSGTTGEAVTPRRTVIRPPTRPFRPAPAPLTRRVVDLQLFAPVWDEMDRTYEFGVSHIARMGIPRR